MEATKGLANINLGRRVKQIVVLIIIILVGVIISTATQAQDYHKSKSKHFKTKYKAQIKSNAHVCDILAKKRNKQSRQPMFAFLKSKPKYKPQAEIDAPAHVRTASRKEKPSVLASAQ
jgi:uncharacterized membrane protein YfhO